MLNNGMKSTPTTGVKPRGFGLPSLSIFKNGHLPSGIVPVSRAIPMHSSCDGGYGSDMDLASDSEDEIYAGSRSFAASPQDDKVSNGSGPNGPRHGFTDNVSSDEVSSKLRGSNEFNVPPGATYTSKGHPSTIYSQQNLKSVAFIGQPRQTKELDEDDVPSAPPFSDSIYGVNQDPEQPSTFRANGTPCPTIASCSAATINETNTMKGMPLGSISSTMPDRFPTYHASGLGPWCGVISYDACVRLCLHNWAKGCIEAPMFLENECALLRTAFGLQQVLLQPEEELLNKTSSTIVSEGVSIKPKKTCGRLKVQVRKVKMVLDPPTGCSFSSIKPPMEKFQSLRLRLSSIKSTVTSEWETLRKVRVTPHHIPANGSFSRQSMGYVHAGTQYLKDVSGLLKIGVTTMRNHSSSYEIVQETYSCSLRLKSSSEDGVVRIQPGSGESHVFLPDGLGDDLVIEVFDSKGKYCGHVLAQVADIADDPAVKLRWWPIYHEPEHELIGRIQLHIHYSSSLDESSHLKNGCVAETIAYDLVLETAMKVQNFQQRNLLLHDPWSWLVAEFANYYGVSDAYTKLRYLSYVMDVATPTADCLNLVHDLLLPVIVKGNMKRTLSHQENRILGEVSEQIEHIIGMVFENYKSLDESSPSGMAGVFSPATGLAAPALESALKLYTLLHNMLTPEAQLKLCKYFQNAVRKRSKRHLAETDEFASGNIDNTLVDAMTQSTAYEKMKSLCFNIRNEIFTDIEIHNQHVLPSFVDLPNLSSSIYSTELCNRLRAFLVAFSPNSPSTPVADLVISTADFQRDLSCWNIGRVKGGVEAKELFHIYITLWIKDKRLELLESCKPDKVKSCGVKTQHSTVPFVDDMYDRLKEMLGEYEVIISRWPEYTFALESAIADVERAIVDTLEKLYIDVLSPLKEHTMPAKAVHYVQKFAKGNPCPYTFPEDLGILFNSMKRMLDVLRPKIQAQIKLWGSCIPDGENAVPGEFLSEVTVMLRTRFRSYLQAVVDKLSENTRLQGATKLKKIVQETNESVGESDIRGRMQPLKDLLTNTTDYLHGILETQVFVILCRGFWDRMGQELLRFLENRKENKSCYKSSRVALSVLDDTFASQLQRLLGNALQDKDLEPPKNILEVRSMLCKESVNQKDNNYYYSNENILYTHTHTQVEFSAVEENGSSPVLLG